MKPCQKYLLVATLLALLYYCADALIDLLFFEQLSFQESLLTGVSTHHLFMRLTAMGFLLVSSFCACWFIARSEALRRRSEQINSVLSAIRNINQIITHEKDRDRLLSSACRTLVDTRGFYSAWIVLVEGGEPQRYFFHAAVESESFPLAETLEQGEVPDCVKSSLASNDVQVFRDPSTDCDECPNSLLYVGRSALTVRLARGGNVYGCLSVSVPQGFADDREEHMLLSEVAGDLAFALESIAAEQDLRRSEQRYQEIFNGSRDGFVMVNSSGAIIDANRACCEMLGYSLEELRALEDFYSITPERWHKWEEEEIWKNRLLRLGYSGVYEKEYIRKDGSVFPVELQAYAVFSDKQELLYLWAVVRDITERQEAEEHLLYLSRVIDQISDRVTVTDLDGRITYINDAECRMLGRDRGEIIGQYTSIYGENPDLGATQEEILRETKIKGEWRGEVVNYRADGSAVILDCRTHVVKDSQGTPVALCGISTDITEKKRTEEAYSRLCRMATDLICVADINTATFLQVNPAFERVLGYSEKELLGRPFLDFVHPDDIEPTIAMVNEKLKAGVEVISFENRYRCKDGSYRCFDWNSHPVPQEGITFAIAHDITERKEAEAERVRLEQQVQQVQRIESVGRLAGGIAHDLNNLLSPILGYCEMLSEDYREFEAVRTPVQHIMQAGLRARDLVRQLLAFSRKQVLEFKSIDLSQVLGGFENLLRRIIREDIAIEVIAAPEIPPVRGDVGQLEQVIMNLAVNAQDAMPNGGRLLLETALVEFDEEYVQAHPETKTGRYVMLAVSDTGIGMDGKTLPHVFEPFFTTKPKEEGTGLGLATVYGIIKQHEGSIAVYSEPGEGTTFKIYLPAMQEADGAETEAPIGLADRRGSETILLVEDNEQVRHLTQAILERQGYKVHAASDGMAALSVAEFQEGRVDLLLTDVIMPNINGKDLYQRLSARYPHVKVLYMSGYTDNVIAHHGVLEPKVDFIQKPFSARALAAKVRKALDKRNPN